MEIPEQAAEVAEEITAPLETVDAVEHPVEPTVESAAAEEGVEEAAPAADPAPEPQIADEPVVEEAPAEERLVQGLIDGDTLVPMSHPDGGVSDAYEANDKGEMLVPAIDVPAMLSHGFVVAAGDE